MSKFLTENNPFKSDYTEYRRFNLENENPISVTYNNKDMTFIKSFWLDMYYYFHFTNQNILIKTKKEHTKESINIKEPKSQNTIQKTLYNPWARDNLCHVLSKTNYKNFNNLIDEKAKYKTEIEYHSNFGLFFTHLNRTLKPGFYLSFENFKEDLLSKTKIGLTWTDVYDYHSIFSYLKHDKNPNFKRFLIHEIDKFNFINSNQKLNSSIFSKMNDIAVGVGTSYLYDDLYVTNGKYKIFLLLEQSLQSVKNQKMVLAFCFCKKNYFDLHMKIKADGFYPDNIYDKTLQEEIRKRPALKNLENDFFMNYSTFSLKGNMNYHINNDFMINTNLKVENIIENSHLGLGFKYFLRDKYNKQHNISFHIDNDYLLKFNVNYVLNQECKINFGVVKNNQNSYFFYPFFNIIFNP